MSGFTFPSLVSNSQATLVCYRGPGCATQYNFGESNFLDFPGTGYPAAPTIADAQSIGFSTYRDTCQGFFIDDLSETPFGDLTLSNGNYTGGFVNVCTGIGASEERLTCDFDHIALVHLTGAEESLRIDSSVVLLVSLEPFCWGGVQVVDGSCTWLGSSLECDGTSATLGVVSTDQQTCCGKLGSSLASSECSGTAAALNKDTCRNEGPPVGFESDSSCVHFTQDNSNVQMVTVPSDRFPSALATSAVVDSCTRFNDNVGVGSTSGGVNARLSLGAFVTVAALLFSSIPC